MTRLAGILGIIAVVVSLLGMGYVLQHKLDVEEAQREQDLKLQLKEEYQEGYAHGRLDELITIWCGQFPAKCKDGKPLQ